MDHLNGEPTIAGQWFERQEVVLAQLEALQHSLTFHAQRDHPQGDLHYQVAIDFAPHESRLGRYHLHWQCATCRFIYDQAEVHNRQLDIFQRQYVLSSFINLPFESQPHRVMTDLLIPPFPPLPAEVIAGVLRAHVTREISPEYSPPPSPASNATDPIPNGSDALHPINLPVRASDSEQD
jgi:hypothetical protein